MCPQGIPDRTSPLMTVPTAPRRPDLMVEPVGRPGFDKVGHAVSLARIAFRTLNVSFTAGDLVAYADLALAVEREIGATPPRAQPPAPNKAGETPSTQVKPAPTKPPRAAPVASNARKRVRPAPKTEPVKKETPSEP